ncbi:MAG: hypothetical protein R2844_11430 [Caldilineales bacterium]
MAAPRPGVGPQHRGFLSQRGPAAGRHDHHYGDGGLAGALLEDRTGVPFTFTGHSLERRNWTSCWAAVRRI